jgi:hypothetical protein
MGRLPVFFLATAAAYLYVSDGKNGPDRGRLEKTNEAAADGQKTGG